MIPKKVEIRPVPGRDGIKDFSDNLEYFSQTKAYTPLVNPETLEYATGLTKEDIAYLTDEKKVPYNLDAVWVKGKAHEFWESGTVKVHLGPTPVFLHPQANYLDFIKYKFLLIHKYIYASEMEMQEGGKPQATHFIYDESSEMKIKASRIEKRNDIIKKVSKLSLDMKRKYILLLFNEITDNKDDNYLTVRLEDAVKDSTKINKLIEYLDLNDEDIILRSMIKKAIQGNVLIRTKKGYFFHDYSLGMTEGAVFNALIDPDGQEIYLAIKQKIEE